MKTLLPDSPPSAAYKASIRTPLTRQFLSFLLEAAAGSAAATTGGGAGGGRGRRDTSAKAGVTATATPSTT